MTDGVNGNTALAVGSTWKTKEFAQIDSAILLPGHDLGAAHRMQHRSIYAPDYMGALDPLPPQTQGSRLLLWALGLLTLNAVRYTR